MKATESLIIERFGEPLLKDQRVVVETVVCQTCGKMTGCMDEECDHDIKESKRSSRRAAQKQG